MADLRYIDYDPDVLWQRMMEAYVEAGGVVPRPGDEKDILLRGVQAFATLQAAQMDTAIKMNTLKFAVGDYLDVIGENRGCPRVLAAKATLRVGLTVTAGGSFVIPSGYAVTQDGQHKYLLSEAVTVPEDAVYSEIVLEAEATGNVYNAVKKEDELTQVSEIERITAVEAVKDATGGQDTETDDEYRERIRLLTISGVTTGPKQQYIALAKSYSPDIIAANAVADRTEHDTGVNVYLLIDENAPNHEAIVEGVQKLLSADDKRPLTDFVTVSEGTEVEYELHYNVYIGPETEILQNEMMQKCAEYEKWQNNQIGGLFNPNKLVSDLYALGAKVVSLVTAESHYDHGTVPSLEQMGAGEYAKGTAGITISVWSEQ